MDTRATDLTRLIGAARDGDDDAKVDLYAAVYGELRKIAATMPRVGGYGDTLQPTALANEVFMQLERKFPLAPDEIAESRATFYWSVALAMRTIIRNHWRAQNAAKRGGGRSPQRIDGDEPKESRPAGEDSVIDALVLDDAMNRLEQYDKRWHRVVMYRYFANRTVEDAAELIGVASSTVKSDWQLARVWLLRNIEGRE